MKTFIQNSGKKRFTTCTYRKTVLQHYITDRRDSSSDNLPLADQCIHDYSVTIFDTNPILKFRAYFNSVFLFSKHFTKTVDLN